VGIKEINLSLDCTFCNGKKVEYHRFKDETRRDGYGYVAKPCSRCRGTGKLEKLKLNK